MTTSTPEIEMKEREAFTPGPWQIRDDMTPDGRLTVIGDVDGEYVDGRAHCTYKTIAVCEDDFGERLANAEANARLIAAAPDLYEALKDLARTVEHAWPSLANTAPLNAARAAILKAEGREG